MAISRAATEAFHQYRQGPGGAASLYYVALPRQLVEQLELGIDGVETQPTTVVDIAPQKALKIQALRTYRSQEDAQELAHLFEAMPEARYEYFHRVYPPAADGAVTDGFWP